MLFFQIVAFYCAIGIIVATFFALFGAQQANAGRVPVSFGARALLIPGAMIFWPLVLARWRAAVRG